MNGMDVVRLMKEGRVSEARKLAGEILKQAVLEGKTTQVSIGTGAGIGVELSKIIERETGSTLGCSLCKAEFARMNSMSGPEVLAALESMADAILDAANGKNSKWLQRMKKKDDSPPIKTLVKAWICEAVRTSQG